MLKRLAILIASTLLVAACGGDDSAATTPADTTSTTTAPPATTTTTVAATTTTAAPTTTTVAATSTTDPAPALPATGVSAILTEVYFTDGDFDPATMGFEPANIETAWYRAEGHYVVLYRGIDAAATGPLCPGASIFTTAFEYISNAPTTGADCSSFPTISDDPGVRALECDGAIAYRTSIPDNVEGTLFGTMERPVGEGIMGATGLAQTAAGEIPEVDVSAFEC
jgi:hypothetical protein